MFSKSIAKSLAFLFLFAFTGEVLSGVTLEHSDLAKKSVLSEKLNNGSWFDFLFEELNESEEDRLEGRDDYLILDPGFAQRPLLVTDLTTSVRQYHLDLYRTTEQIPLFTKHSVRLI